MFTAAGVVEAAWDRNGVAKNGGGDAHALAAATLITTSDLSTPAVVATFACKLALSLSGKASTLPLTIIVTTTVPVEGGVGVDGGVG